MGNIISSYELSHSKKEGRNIFLPVVEIFKAKLCLRLSSPIAKYSVAEGE